MIAAAEFILVGNGVDDVIELINVGANANRFFLNAGINFGNHHDGGVDGASVFADFAQEISECGDAEVDPPAKIGIGKVAEL